MNTRFFFSACDANGRLLLDARNLLGHNANVSASSAQRLELMFVFSSDSPLEAAFVASAGPRAFLGVASSLPSPLDLRLTGMLCDTGVLCQTVAANDETSKTTDQEIQDSELSGIGGIGFDEHAQLAG